MNRTIQSDLFPARNRLVSLTAPTERRGATTFTSDAVPVSHTAPSLADVYYTLFRHKWRIMLCTLAGVVAAAALYRFTTVPYQSEAKLFVRYIISENKALGPSTHDATAKSPDERGETIMKSEAEILSSLDLARQVAEGVGPEKILAKLDGGKDLNRAILAIKSNLAVNVTPSSTVIHVVFRHPDPTIVQPVLRELIERYLKLHVETHTANGMLGDFLTQETDQLRSRLSHTEEELRKATVKAGIISLEDAKKTYGEQLTAIRRELFATQAELAQRGAVLEELQRATPTTSTSEQPDAPVPSDILSQYQTVSQQVQQLRQQERDLLTQFTPQNARVQEIHALLATAIQTRADWEAKYPKLVHISAAAQANHDPAIDPFVVATQITALQAKAKALTQQLDDVRNEFAKVDQMEGTIVELRRKKELEEANYRYYSASLEQSRINEALGNGRVSNISQIQTPSPPFSDRGQTNKILGLLAGGGLFAGIIWAFLIELYLDRSIKRPIDVERALPAPLFLAVPALNRKAVRTLQAPPLMLTAANGHAPNGAPVNGTNGHNGHAAVAMPTNALQLFHETLRDRLVTYFESVNLTHKPKLVAVTSLGHDAGVTTTAAGLARTMSETTEGNVLLVDMTLGQGAAQQFMKGKAVCGLDELLIARDSAHVDDNLYVVAESNSDRLTRNMPQRFSKLVPKLKASDFDYIIFDMPPVSQISITPRLAGFMDMVLVVVESEKTNRESLQRASNMLAEAGAHVGIVLNKTKRYVPGRLDPDVLS